VLGIAGLKVHVELAGLFHATVEREIHRFRRGAGTDAREHLVIGRDLLTHDDNLVPFRIRITADHRTQSACSFDERVPVAPDEINFTKFREQILVLGINFKRAVDQISGLVIQAIGHVEVRFCRRICLIEIDRALALEGIVERPVVPYVGDRFLDFRNLGYRFRRFEYGLGLILDRGHLEGIRQQILCGFRREHGLVFDDGRVVRFRHGIFWRRQRGLLFDNHDRRIFLARQCTQAFRRRQGLAVNVILLQRLPHTGGVFVIATSGAAREPDQQRNSENQCATDNAPDAINHAPGAIDVAQYLIDQANFGWCLDIDRRDWRRRVLNFRCGVIGQYVVIDVNRFGIGQRVIRIINEGIVNAGIVNKVVDR